MAFLDLDFNDPNNPKAQEPISQQKTGGNGGGFLDSINPDIMDKLLATIGILVTPKGGKREMTSTLSRGIQNRRERRKEKAKAEKSAKKEQAMAEKEMQMNSFMQEAMEFDLESDDDVTVDNINRTLKRYPSLSVDDAFDGIGKITATRKNIGDIRREEIKRDREDVDRDYTMDRRPIIDDQQDRLINEKIKSLQAVRAMKAKTEKEKGGVYTEKDLSNIFMKLHGTAANDFSQLENARVNAIDPNSEALFNEQQLNAFKSPQAKRAYINERAKDLWIDEMGNIPMPQSIREGMTLQGQETAGTTFDKLRIERQREQARASSAGNRPPLSSFLIR